MQPSTMTPPAAQPQGPSQDPTSPAPGQDQGGSPETAQKLVQDAQQGCVCSNCEYFKQDEEPAEGECLLAKAGKSPLMRVEGGGKFIVTPDFYCVAHELAGGEPGETDEQEAAEGQPGGGGAPGNPSPEEVRAMLQQLMERAR